MLDRRGLLIANSQQGGVLPQGYTQLNYLESTGTQYINTGYYPDAETTIIANCGSASTSDNVYLFGCNVNSNSNNYLLLAFKATYRPQLRFNGARQAITGESYGLFDGELHSVTTSVAKHPLQTAYSLSLNIDDVAVHSTVYVPAFTCPHPLILFGFNNNGTIQPNANVLIGEFAIADSGAEVWHGIPCLDNNSIPCMYDTISKQTFYNAGTGEFLYG